MGLTNEPDVISHGHVACTLGTVRHLEYFHAHARIEHVLFDGTLTPVEGTLRLDLSRPGLGLEFKRKEAEQYGVG